MIKILRMFRRYNDIYAFSDMNDDEMRKRLNETYQLIHDDEFFEVSEKFVKQFDEGCLKIINEIKAFKLDDEKNYVRNIDKKIVMMLRELILPPNFSFSEDFWGSITIKIDSAYELTRLRWREHKIKWFRENTEKKLKVNRYNRFGEEMYDKNNKKQLVGAKFQYRRYLGTFNEQTFSRLWKLAKYTPNNYLDTALKQQDFIDKFFEKKGLDFWEGDYLENEYTSKIFLATLKFLEKFDKDSTLERQEVVRRAFSSLILIRGFFDISSSFDEIYIHVEEAFERVIEELNNEVG